MVEQYPKRLIEVDLPIKRISVHARREKSIRHGHISALHIWWARRPLAACRAVICASLWPDPADPLCPQSFRDAAAEQIIGFAKAATTVGTAKEVEPICSDESWKRYGALAKGRTKLDTSGEDNLKTLRNLLLDFIADAAAWEASTNRIFLTTARNLTQAAHEALSGAPGTRPLVVDPFAGGGAIPLEALRMGADAFASDLNPVSVLLNKVVLEYIPKHGKRLADEVRKWGQWVKEQAEKELAEFYPKDPDGSTPIAYLWARTITCEGPGCGAEIPLMRSMWLSKKGKNSVALKVIVRPRAKRVDFELVRNPKAVDVASATVSQGVATCPVCGYTTQVSSVRRQLSEREGGSKDARLLAVVVTRPNEKGKHFRLPATHDFVAVQKASAALSELVSESTASGRRAFPEEAIDPSEPRRIPLALYGMTHWSQLFTQRQLVATATFIRIVRQSPIESSDAGLTLAVRTLLSLSASKLSDRNSTLCRWIHQNQSPGYTFARQALPMLWDFAESCPLSSGGGWDGILHDSTQTIETQSSVSISGQVEHSSATRHPLPDDACQFMFTDPPYYYSIPYANLSDFFYVWLKIALNTVHPQLFESELTCKDEEVIQNLPHKGVAHIQKDRTFYENGMRDSLAEGRRVTMNGGVGAVVFAHMETQAWEALLAALIQAGWCVTASWPIDTERGARMVAQRQITLASSVHLVCRPRKEQVVTAVGDWREVLQELPGRIHEWMPRLAEEDVVGADAIFACLGPALEIFSRYSKVEKASGEEVTLPEYLEHVWAAVSQEALRMVFEGADASGFEEDARLTAMWLWTLGAGNGNGDATGEKVVASAGYVLEFDAARKIAQGLGAHLEQLTSVVEVKGDKARLLPVSERAGHLFGKGEVTATAKRKKKKQRSLFELLDEDEQERLGLSIEAEKAVAKLGETALDRIHQAMILFAAGRSEAVRRFLIEEGVGRDSRFWTLAQALSALYPSNSEEKRWVDGILARKKSLGF